MKEGKNEGIKKLRIPAVADSRGPSTVVNLSHKEHKVFLLREP